MATRHDGAGSTTMGIQSLTISPRNRTGLRARRGLAAGLWMLLAPTLLVQGAAAQQSAQPPAQAAPPTPGSTAQPGVFEAIGRWLDQSAAGFRSHIQGAKERIDDLNSKAASTGKNLGETAVEVGKNAADVTKDAVGAVARLPLSRVVSGRERCTLAPNGAPDCLSAAEALCRKEGFATGKSIDFTSAQQCPPRAWLSRQSSGAECTTVTFVSRAMCQ
jgi:hypothetical protein